MERIRMSLKRIQTLDCRNNTALFFALGKTLFVFSLVRAWHSVDGWPGHMTGVNWEFQLKNVNRSLHRVLSDWPVSASHDNVRERANVAVRRFTRALRTNTISVHVCVMPFWRFYSLHKHVAKTLLWGSIWVSVCAVNKRLALDFVLALVSQHVIGGERCVSFAIQKQKKKHINH